MKVKYIEIPDGYFSEKYPTHIEVPEDYWIYSHNVKYSSKENNND